MMYKAKKSLGQNFLKSEPALRKIIEAGNVKKSDVILEIGPGKGKLTEKLLEKSNNVIAVEKDWELFEFLKIKFSKETNSGSLVLVHGDILEFSISNFQFLKYKIVANIPYNITGAILKKFLTEKIQPELMVLMVQREVAKRIMGIPASAKGYGVAKKESILSISVKAYGDPKMVMKVPARYFSPAPKVDSAVILIKDISRKNFAPLLVEKGVGGGDSLGTTSPSALLLNKEERFWEIVKAGFAHKRKKLSGNLKSVRFSQNNAILKFADKRAEDLTLEDWITLAGQ